jgi:hypothetical protein
MIDFTSVKLREFVVHFVGNKLRDDKYQISVGKTIIEDNKTQEIVLKYLLSSFGNDESFNLFHPSDIKLNEVYSFVNNIFVNNASFYSQSIEIAKHLYEKSIHPKINGGELYVCLFSNCIIHGKPKDAVGIFRSESKESYLKVIKTKNNFNISSEQGLNVAKLEKGCLILNDNKNGGYIAYIIDSTKSSEAQYWKDEFLKIKPSSDNYHTTQSYLDVCKQFVVNQLEQEYEINKTDKIDYLNKTVDYFKRNGAFSEKEFLGEVFDDKEVIKSFRNFKKEYTTENDIELEDTFEISNAAVKKQARVFKSVLKLDKNFHVYIHGDKSLIEKGYDSKVGKSYYKIYFDEES